MVWTLNNSGNDFGVRMKDFFLVMLSAVVMIGAVAVVSDVTAEQAKPVTIVAFGDSLTAGYGLEPAKAFPVQLEAALKAKGANVRIVNAGVSGDTTSGGVERLEWTLQEGADAVILELGGNDALRGIAPDKVRANLDAMLTTIKGRKLDVLLAGMRAPSNWGGDYQKAFDAMYPELAEKHGALLYPFFLDGVAMNRALILDDGIHPTADGIAEIVKRILPNVEQLVERVQARRTASN
jgi:acyl-CoA thioesterase I